METVFWLLVLFVVVFFANIARRNKMIKRHQALQQQQEQNAADMEHQASPPTFHETDVKRSD